MEDLQKLMDDIGVWSDSQFGEGRNPISILHHLKKETTELIQALEEYQALGLKDGAEKDKALKKVLFEYSDNFTLIIDSARCAGLLAHILMDFSRLKLDINKKRKWGEPDENGVVEHVREDKD